MTQITFNFLGTSEHIVTYNLGMTSKPSAYKEHLTCPFFALISLQSRMRFAMISLYRAKQ